MNTLKANKLLLGLLLILPAFGLSADVRKSKSFLDSHESSIFYTYEANGEDYIYGVGIGFTYRNPDSKLGFAVTTSLNQANVTTLSRYQEDYTAWEAGAKFGLFSNISLYGEVGIDLSEMLFNDIRYHYDDCYNCDIYYNHRYRDDIDAYVGLGAGLNVGPLKVEAFTRYREIDSRYWEAASEKFSGIQFSVNF